MRKISLSVLNLIIFFVCYGQKEIVLKTDQTDMSLRYNTKNANIFIDRKLLLKKINSLKNNRNIKSVDKKFIYSYIDTAKSILKNNTHDIEITNVILMGITQGDYFLQPYIEAFLPYFLKLGQVRIEDLKTKSFINKIKVIKNTQDEYVTYYFLDGREIYNTLRTYEDIPPTQMQLLNE